jgi:hypothetical protein
LEEQSLEDDREIVSTTDYDAEENQRKLEQLRKEIAANDAKQRELQELESMRWHIEEVRDGLRARIDESVRHIAAERSSMLREVEQLEDIGEAFKGNRQKLDEIIPSDWDNDTLKKYAPQVEIVFRQIESDFDDASAHCQGMKHTEVLCSPGWKTQLAYNFRMFYWQFLKGLAFHLPLFLLLLIVFLIYNCSHTSSL